MDINVLTILIGLIKGVDNVAQVRDDLADRFLYIAVLLLTAGSLPVYITGPIARTRAALDSYGLTGLLVSPL
jgi:hypothetical protein